MRPGGYTAAIIGCGRVAWMLEDDPLEVKPCTHAGAYIELAKTGRIELVAGADLDHERLAAFGRRFEPTSLYPDYRRMLKEVRPDIVSVCAYAGERFRMVMDALEAGVRGIWCEKAFAASLKEARIMAEACAGDGVPLIVSHMRRWSPQYQKAKEMIDAGAIGRLESVVSRFSGSLIHTGTHAFDVLRWFCGPVDWVEGRLEDRAGRMVWDAPEDRGGRALIQFRDGAYATVHAETKNYFIFEFDVAGSDGRIRIGNNGLLEYQTPRKSLNNTGIMELYPAPFPACEAGNVWTGALKNLLDCVDGAVENLSSPEDGYNALEIALAIHLSAKGSSKRIYLPLEDMELSVRSR